MIAGILISGLAIVFYKIPISPELLTAIEKGTAPEKSTTVYRFVPRTPGSVESVKDWETVFQSLTAFKKLLDSARPQCTFLDNPDDTKVGRIKFSGFDLLIADRSEG